MPPRDQGSSVDYRKKAVLQKHTPGDRSSPATKTQTDDANRQEVQAESARVQLYFASKAEEFNNHFQAQADATRKMIWTSGPDSLCTFCNQSWLRFRGRTLEQEVGLGWTQGVHPDDLERTLNTYRIAFESRQAFRTESRFRRADGGFDMLVWHGVPQYLLNGRFIGFVGSLEKMKQEDSRFGDRTQGPPKSSYSVRQALGEMAANLGPVSTAERKHYTKRSKQVSLHSVEQALRSSLEFLPTPVIVLGRDWGGVYCNHAFRNFAAMELLSGGVFGSGNSTYPDRNLPPEVLSWLDSPLIPDPLYTKIVMQPLTGFAGHQLTCFSILETSHETQENQRETAFLHELLNVTAGIEMLANLLAESTLPTDQEEYAKLLQTGVKHLSPVIQKERMRLESSGHSTVVSDGREVLHALATRDPRIRIASNPTASASVLSDRAVLMSDLDNIVQKALEDCTDDDHVTLGCRLVKREVEFWVRHSGKPGSKADGREPTDKDHGTTLSVRYPAAPERAYSESTYPGHRRVS